jgi:hypothetical protein
LIMPAHARGPTIGGPLNGPTRGLAREIIRVALFRQMRRAVAVRACDLWIAGGPALYCPAAVRQITILSEDSQCKPPTLMEICGPLMMSYPAANHLQYRFKVEGGVTCLVFLDRAMGSILPEHRDGLPKGWQHWLERIRDLAQRKNRKETKR